ncbi:class I SAM-dependent methyltransferase [Archangium lipolyticum]|uniref:class I SAM-dependent methyltransferase n=1 Tax=Archangium lipolyticum TaxID=2970465 RepID=UPI002149DDAF|nr:class I SAM-dependent methyltransferase [Archangium lipolyticum]
MPEAVDYFSNHRLKLRLPWRLYHGPIVQAAARVVRESGAVDVLNVGSGPFFEFPSLPQEGRRYTLCDIDPRAMSLARSLHGEKLAGADVIQPDAPLPYPGGRFDLVLSMDVIEHLHRPGPWLADLMRVVRPGGQVFLTTPNYGSLSLLPLIEKTVLEAIARVQGFTRRGLHPTPFDKPSLVSSLREAGAVDVRVETISFGWVLAATARRPHAS